MDWFRGGAVVAAVVLGGVLPVAQADTVFLEDGSRINGKIVSLSADNLIIDTAFAQGLEIERARLTGLASDDAVDVRLASGQSTRAKFGYDEQSRSQVVAAETNATDGPLTLDDVSQIAPRVVAAQQEDDDYALPESDSLPPEDADYWSGDIEVGLNGRSGNTDTSAWRTRLSALRDTGDTRLSMSASADREEEDDETTAEEYLGNARFEDDLTQRLFWFVQQELERDEFEDIDLRSRSLIGPGYFLARRDRLTFKVRSGVGHQYERYSSGGSSHEAIFSAGWDYAQLVGEWLKLTHDFTIYPEVSNSPSENFILESALGVEVPIANSNAWHLRAGLEHEYNNNPEPGVEDLDTTYNLGVVRGF
jgi:putative salt-induced outer membrane protein YdiY